MIDINAVKDDLRRDEGFVSHAYKDHLGYLTIGIGRMIDERRCGGITEEEAEYLLSNDIASCIKVLRDRIDFFDRLPDNVKRALVNMAFQLGIDGLMRFKKTLSYIDRGEYEQAAQEALNSNWAKQTPERAKRVTDLIRGKH